MDWRSHIFSDPSIMFGKPCIRNTRIPVDLILEKLGNGDTIQDLLDAYPKISEQDIKACIGVQVKASSQGDTSTKIF